MESKNGEAARCSSSVAAEGIIHHTANPTTGAQAGQARNGARIGGSVGGSDQGGRRGKVSATEASRFWRTVNMGEKIAQAGGAEHE